MRRGGGARQGVAAGARAACARAGAAGWRQKGRRAGAKKKRGNNTARFVVLVSGSPFSKKMHATGTRARRAAGRPAWARRGESTAARWHGLRQRQGWRQAGEGATSTREGGKKKKRCH